ncbi:hypothetical protein KDA23_07085, partial [Candidatus Saccharibacteria bacterium]|nr:hypothetical protein [Candidatus Saccharibacteria bacterium]
GTHLLEGSCQQMAFLKKLCLKNAIRLVGCGGITDATAATRQQKAGADEGQMATVPYFRGDKAVQQIIQEQYA